MKRLAPLLAMALTLVGVVALKHHYSVARPEELRWILLPSTRLVELWSGHHFEFESGIGYVSSGAMLAVTKACAGVNFLLVAWLSLSATWLVRLNQQARPGHAWAAPVLCLAVAYVTAVLVNAVRIMGALVIHGPHQLWGTLLYVVSLFALHAGQRWFLSKRDQPALTVQPKVEPERGNDVSSLLWLLPLGAYWAITLVIPVLRGVTLDETFMRHGLVVMTTSLSVGLFFWAISRWRAGSFPSSRRWKQDGVSLAPRREEPSRQSTAA